MKKPARACSRCGKANCQKHKRQAQIDYDLQRPSAAERGYDAAWHKERNDHLRQSPLCLDCLEMGIVKEAKEVHHVDGNPFNRDRKNKRSLCMYHHNKTKKHISKI